MKKIVLLFYEPYTDLSMTDKKTSELRFKGAAKVTSASLSLLTATFNPQILQILHKTKSLLDSMKQPHSEIEVPASVCWFSRTKTCFIPALWVGCVVVYIVVLVLFDICYASQTATRVLNLAEMWNESDLICVWTVTECEAAARLMAHGSV